MQSILLKQLILTCEEDGMLAQMNAWDRANAASTQLSHPNVLKLLATCFEPTLIASLFEGTTGATLNDLMKSKRCKWKDLSMLPVAEGIASGMEYIQGTTNKPHGHLCPSNVLFSLSYQVKIASAGEDRCWSKDYIATSHAGSFCYLSPSVLKGEASTLKDDVYR